MTINWQGFLFKATQSGDVFPDKYINYESYDTTPNQREEIKAYRDDNSRELHRITADGMKSTFTFTTRDNLDLQAMNEIMTFFMSNETNQKERKIQLTYWDNEQFTYKTGFFYRSNQEFKIKKISNNNIWYKEMTFKLIEY